MSAEWAAEWRNGKSWPWLLQYNNGPWKARYGLLKAHLAEVGEDCCIRAPFYCEVGENIYLGDQVYMNFGCVLLDTARIQIGSSTMFGPGVHIYTSTHDKDHGDTQAAAVFVGDNVWVGGGTIILPGIQIGDAATIGAGSIVTRNVPAGATVMGNPARIAE